MHFIRTWVEQLSRGKSFWRRLPPPFQIASVLVTPDAALAHLKWGSDWCNPDLRLIVDRFIKGEQVVWDIGANVGLFGTMAAVRSGENGRIVCLEPDLVLAQLIQRTASKLPKTCAPINVIAAAVTDRAGMAELLIAERGRASNALSEFGGRSQMGGVRERQIVPTTSLDGLLEVVPPPSFVKIDVEGAERTILNGAKRLLTEIRPMIYIEVGEANRGEVTTRFREASYNLFDPKLPMDNQQPLTECCRDTLAIPN